MPKKLAGTGSEGAPKLVRWEAPPREARIQRETPPKAKAILRKGRNSKALLFGPPHRPQLVIAIIRKLRFVDVAGQSAGFKHLPTRSCHHCSLMTPMTLWRP